MVIILLWNQNNVFNIYFSWSEIEVLIYQVINKYDSIKSCKDTAKMNILLCNFIENKIILLPISKIKFSCLNKILTAYFHTIFFTEKGKMCKSFLNCVHFIVEIWNVSFLSYQRYGKSNCCFVRRFTKKR